MFLRGIFFSVILVFCSCKERSSASASSPLLLSLKKDSNVLFVPETLTLVRSGLSCPEKKVPSFSNSDAYTFSILGRVDAKASLNSFVLSTKGAPILLSRSIKLEKATEKMWKGDNFEFSTDESLLKGVSISIDSLPNAENKTGTLDLTLDYGGEKILHMQVSPNVKTVCI